MWEHYRKTLIPMQLFIIAACAAAYLFKLMPWQAVLVTFVVMQLGALLGAWWGYRLRRQIIRQSERDDELPGPQRLTRLSQRPSRKRRRLLAHELERALNLDAPHECPREHIARPRRRDGNLRKSEDAVRMVVPRAGAKHKHI